MSTSELQPLTDFLSTEGAEVAGPSDFIMTRGGAGDEEEEEPEDSDTDDIDHSGERVRRRKLRAHTDIRYAKLL